LNLRASDGRHARVVRRWAARALDEAPETDSPEADALDGEELEALGSALERLSRDARVGLLLRASGCTSAEVAALLGRSDPATRSLLCRARAEVRALFETDRSDDTRC
jgi:DNA-directed RNA polymerase specialized sigma24 family protein